MASELYIGEMTVRNQRAGRYIRIAGAMVNELIGDNEQGKSSALDGAEGALRGGKTREPAPLRHGALKGGTVLDLVADLLDEVPALKVERRLTPKNGSGVLKVTPEVKGGEQRALDDLFSDVLFYVLDIAERRAGENKAAFRARVAESMEQLARPGYMEEKTAALAELAAAITRRQDLKRELDRYGKMTPPPKVEPVDAGAIDLQLQAAEKFNRLQQERALGIDRAKEDMARASDSVATLRAAFDTHHEHMEQAAEEALAAVAICSRKPADIEDWAGQWRHAGAMAERVADIAMVVVENGDSLNSAARNAEAVAEVLGKLDPPEPEQDTAALRQQLVDASETNAQARTRAEFELRLASQIKTGEDLAAVEMLVDEIKGRLADLTMTADIPIDGLEWSDDGISINGDPWDQLSAGERRLEAARLAMAVNDRAKKPLKALFMKDGGLIDDANFTALVAAATTERIAKGLPPYQLWIETPRIEHAGDHQVILIEAGESSVKQPAGVTAISFEEPS